MFAFPARYRVAMTAIVIGLFAFFPIRPTKAQSNEQARTPASVALSTLFSPMDTPKRKTMGLLQRNFLEMASDSQSELEVALVIDGTDSMSNELSGVRQSVNRMLADLRRFRTAEVRAAVVVFRDHGAPSGEVSLPLKDFSADEATISAAVAKLTPESGAPFFQELPDLGLHKAITELPWSDDPGVTKWILLFGDAPPYDVAMQHPDHPSAKRRYTDELLVSLARNRGIRINSVLCTSGDDNTESYNEVIDQTRGFMSRLAADTDGVMLDLSYPEIQKALVDAGKRPDVAFAGIRAITSADLVAARRISAGEATLRNVSIAVIPHEPLDSVQFDPRRESVRVSTAIRHQFSQLPGVRTISPVDIQRQLRRLRAEGLADVQIIRGLAGRLGVDYVVWGKLLPQNASIQTAAYRRADGQAVVQVSFDGDRGKLTDVILTAAANDNSPGEAISQLARAVQGSASSAALSGKIAETGTTTAELLSAIESLEQALAYATTSDESLRLLQTAKRSAETAASVEPRNAIAQWLVANANFNLAARSFRQGDPATAEPLVIQSKSALRRAAREATRIESNAIGIEILADASLLIQKDAEQAIALYESLTTDEMPLASQRRGHWMLAGIRAGDWGVTPSAIDVEKSRSHVIQILADWPESPEAVQLKQWLLWDETTDQTRHNYLPLMNQELGKFDGV